MNCNCGRHPQWACFTAVGNLNALQLSSLFRQALSVTLRRQTLDSAMRNVGKLKAAVDKCKATDEQRLKAEYQRLIGGLQVCWLCQSVMAGHYICPHIVVKSDSCRLHWFQPKTLLPRRDRHQEFCPELPAHAFSKASELNCGSCPLQERGALPRGRPTPGGEDWLANPALPEDILREAVRSHSCMDPSQCMPTKTICAIP